MQIDVQGSITLDESSLVRIAAQNGVGLGYVMEADVREDIAAGRLVRVLEDWTPALAPLALYYPGRKTHQPPLARSSKLPAILRMGIASIYRGTLREIKYLRSTCIGGHYDALKGCEP